LSDESSQPKVFPIQLTIHLLSKLYLTKNAKYMVLKGLSKLVGANVGAHFVRFGPSPLQVTGYDYPPKKTRHCERSAAIYRAPVRYKGNSLLSTFLRG
jgi:hypothetical protein